MVVAITVAMLALQACVMSPGMRGAGRSDSEDWFPNEAVSYKNKVLQVQPISMDVISRLEQQRKSDARHMAELLAPKDDVYRIGPTDILTITVWDHPELTIPAGSFRDAQEQGQLVGEDGSLYYPFVGNLQVAGMSVAELRDVLTRRLSKYIMNPQLDVRVAGFRSQKLYVVGEVQTPGILPLTDQPMTIADAVNLAGGLTPNAHKGGVNVSRRGQVYEVDLTALYDLADATQNLTLKNGDIVNVPDRSQQKVYVMGEVEKPGSVEIINGRLNLSAALGEVGGVNQVSANPGRIYVVRHSSGEEPQIFHLNAEYAYGMLLAERFEMQPQDVVFVDTAGVSKWNRVISQILPTATLLNYALP